MSAPRVLIVGGGTGGHVIPALAIADELRQSYGAHVRFLGTERGFETRLVPAAGYRLELIQVGQLKGVSLKTRLRTLLDLPLGIQRCLSILKTFRPDVVVGVGGYASGPGMAGALLKGIPTLAFEPNAAPGLANRIVGRLVSSAAVSFAPACAYFRNARVTGIPVRKEFFTIKPRIGPPEETLPDSQATSTSDSVHLSKQNLLVFGGSQGAQIFNQLMPRIAPQLLRLVPDLFILHQSGAKQEETTRAAYVASGAEPNRWEVRAFLDNMPERFAWADLILARSGASTVAELCAAGRPALLVPFPLAADDHQRKNAEVMVSAHAAEMRLQTEVGTGELLLDALSRLLLAPAKLIEMGNRARTLARPNAAADIAAMVAALVRSPSHL
ncbi:UDP-N-acetylglucosamine--N-acetylmuramyl-(pentapeptide) pyrophosphoryl-undecaprenol N-acetylglucosamine transferase [Acidisarcina polymorpha]|uniref:UDP-N-acetylglucosamine--N-acetylmuramyl-(pentapeptide) pyrophosphoryl-undecaprenol N-acetylglucosamine transferase n=1 Tax=Acidisarcina polymorpha TaxID=2211140 RepID=A0A2Z5G3S8_9BACT|nr:undecaprenyldiphospho-muramoylpentapeptide beta-N-acetylglucosaminyltransferase [Acidisarcina polymorpha]AXC13454.1 UDP-N-acetylglucosamine--N-acetylmuramyl-(pentapeptide) pyrophosphoryl-undecaprenol N-acetylglucosamine transferase [Acidisarcina polymorpha]